jgi:putative transposase
VARLRSSRRLWSVFARKRGLTRKAGPPVHDDHVQRDFTAAASDQLWLPDITGHRTDEGKPCRCAIKDVCSNRIGGYSIDSRTKASLAVPALHNAIALRDPKATVDHSDSETVRTGIPGVLDSHSDGPGRMLVPGAPGVLEPHFD